MKTMKIESIPESQGKLLHWQIHWVRQALAAAEFAARPD